jgi:hypothetical protein
MLDHDIRHAAIGFYMAKELAQGGYSARRRADAYHEEATARSRRARVWWLLFIGIVDH